MSQIDAEKIALAVNGPEAVERGRLRLAEYDVDEAMRMVWVAAEKWLSRDIYDLEIEGVEELQEHPTPWGRVKMVFDVRARTKGRLNNTKKYAGQPVIVDWKTTLSTFDARWVNRYFGSWQSKFYSHFGQAPLIIYRGINRHHETKEILVEPGAGNTKNVLIQMEGLFEQRDALIKKEFSVWPRRMPAACGEYGRECPYILECPDLIDIPSGAIPANKSFSFSSMEKFMQCPERYRRGVLESEAGGADKEGSDESDFGLAVHRGLAELYRQVKEKFQGEAS